MQNNVFTFCEGSGVCSLQVTRNKIDWINNGRIWTSVETLVNCSLNTEIIERSTPRSRVLQQLLNTEQLSTGLSTLLQTEQLNC